MFNVVEEVPRMRAGRTLALTGIAVLAVLVLIAGYVYINRTPPTAEGAVSAVWLYQPLPAQMKNNALPPPSNGLIMLVPLKVRNLSSKPLAIMDISAVARVGDTDYKSYDAAPSDFDKVFQYYPDLAEYRQPEISRHVNIPPGTEAQGLAVFNYALTEDQWSKASAFYIDVTFDTTPYILHLTWPTYPAHGHIAAVLPPVIPQAPPEKPPSANP